MHRLATVLREIARGGFAGLIAGVLVGGVGGRIVMGIAAAMSPDAVGLRTENGELIGRFTIEGTFALIVFGGLSASALGAVTWVIVSPWVPGAGLRRALVMMPIAVAIGSFLLVESTNSDFLILSPLGVIMAMLVVLVALNGAVIALLDDALDERLPRPGVRPLRAAAAYGFVAVLGLPMLVLTLAAFFSPEFAIAARPPFVGAALLVVGLATAASWGIRLRRDATATPPFVTWAGRLGLVAAVALGGIHLAAELSRILQLG
jgi:hypothetical protein